MFFLEFLRFFLVLLLTLFVESSRSFAVAICALPESFSEGFEGVDAGSASALVPALASASSSPSA